MKSNDFITKFGHATFRHSAELFAAIRSGDCVLTHATTESQSAACSHFLQIYRFRSEHLRQYTSPHAASILLDIEALISELERSPDEPCDLWGFALPPHHTFCVFEGLVSQRILGCIRAVDQRLIDEPAWEKLWREQTGET